MRYYWKYIVGLAILVALVIGILLTIYVVHQRTIIHSFDPKLSTEQMSQRQTGIDQIRADITKAESNKASKEDRFALYAKLGSELLVIGKLDDARAAYTTAIKLLPGNPVGYQEMFQVQLAMHDYDDAEDTIKKAVKLNPASPNNWVQYISLEKDPLKVTVDKRIKLSEQAQTKTSKADNVMNQYGLLLEEKGDLPRAYAVLRELVLKSPNVHEYSMNLDRVNVEIQKKQIEERK